MNKKSRGNYSLTPNISQERWNEIFKWCSCKEPRIQAIGADGHIPKANYTCCICKKPIRLTLEMLKQSNPSWKIEE